VHVPNSETHVMERWGEEERNQWMNEEEEPFGSLYRRQGGEMGPPGAAAAPSLPCVAAC
jgi:hypothetical protein